MAVQRLLNDKSAKNERRRHFLCTEDAKLGAKFGQFFNLRKINLFLNISDLNPEIWKFTLGHFAALVHFVQPTNQSNFLPFFGLPVPEIDTTRGFRGTFLF